jgi:Tfp pilus assembly protein FimT
MNPALKDRLRGQWLGNGGCSKPRLAAPRSTFHVSRITHHVSRFTAAFTLIEVMVVAAIMMLVMSIGVPIVYNSWHKQPLTTAINDVIEVCGTARARAILQGTPTEVHFHPQEGQLEVAGGGSSRPSASAGGVGAQSTIPGSTGIASAKFSDRVIIDMIDVNLFEYKDSDLARVRFFPDGRCDELIVILRSVEGEQRGVTLEITTGLPMMLNQNDLQNLRR